MRGAISAAALSALEDLNFTRCFDVVYGISAGAINAAYFLTEKTWYPLSIYYDDLTDSRFLDLRRPFFGRDLMDIDYAYDHVVRSLKPLDYERVLRSPIPLVVGMTDINTISLESVRDFTSPDDLHAALRASAWLPVALRGSANFRGNRKVDGGVLAMSPRPMALRDGATHILSLSTKPMDMVRGRETPAVAAVAAYLNRLSRGLGDGYRENLAYFRNERSQLVAARTHPTTNPPWILDLAPLPGTPELSRHERRPWKVMTAMRSAYAETWVALERIKEDDLYSGNVASFPRLTLVDRRGSSR